MKITALETIRLGEFPNLCLVYTGWYTELVTGLPVVEGGRVRSGSGPGLGVELRPGLAERPDALVRRSEV
jgi:L-alanine-DL-glutamate epimerase-like enolase superfamily enzyme